MSYETSKFSQEYAKIENKEEKDRFLKEQMVAINNILAKSGEINDINYPQENSLLFDLASCPLTEFSDLILREILSDKKIDLRNKGYLLETIIKQNNISSDPDATKLFDLLVQRGIPLPSAEILKDIVSHDRSRSGNNSAKLARSFILYSKGYNDLENNPIESLILEYEDKHKSRILDSVILKKSLSSKFESEQEFKNALKALIKLNDDIYIDKALKNNSSLIQKITDHVEVLNVAIDFKQTKTFKKLIDAGFVANKNPNNKPNSIAFACANQSKSTLKFYFDAVGNKLPDLLKNPDESGKTALDYAIEGKSYISTITLLHSNGCSLNCNLWNRLENIIEGNHSATLDFFLKNSNISNDERLLNKVVLIANEKEDNRVLSSVILNFIETNNLEERIDADELLRLSSKTHNNDDAFQKLTISDFYELCKTSSKSALSFYVKQRSSEDSEFNFRDEVNQSDARNKKPLYYAISNNAYNELVEELLNNGADIENIGADDQGKVLNGLSLIIKNQEYSTLDLVLKKCDISTKSRDLIFSEITKAENNNHILHQIFLENSSPEYLLSNKKLTLNLFDKLVENSDISSLKILFSKNQNNYQNSLFNVDSDEFLEKTIEIFELEKSEESKEILSLLLENGIIPSESQKKFLQNEGFIPKSFCGTVFDCLSKLLPSNHNYERID